MVLARSTPKGGGLGGKCPRGTLRKHRSEGYPAFTLFQSCFVKKRKWFRREARLWDCCVGATLAIGAFTMFGNGARTIFLSACHLKLDARFGQDLSLPLRAARQKPRPHLRQGFSWSDRRRQFNVLRRKSPKRLACLCSVLPPPLQCTRPHPVRPAPRARPAALKGCGPFCRNRAV